MTELLPCPFCGDEAKVFHYSSAIRDEVWRAVCDKPFCAQGPDGYTEAEAIAAWNTRAERTCKLVRQEVELPESLKNCDVEINVYECSNCSEPAFSNYNYCPNCGARVKR